MTKQILGLVFLAGAGLMAPGCRTAPSTPAEHASMRALLPRAQRVAVAPQPVPAQRLVAGDTLGLQIVHDQIVVVRTDHPVEGAVVGVTAP